MILRRIGIAALALWVLTQGAPQGRQVRESVLLGTLDGAGIEESSGIAASRDHPGVFWTHNDSGDGPYLYAIDDGARLLARYEVVGARAVDWEDLALGPCPNTMPRTLTCLLIADTGDNLERRRNAAIYIVPEPDPTEGNGRERRTAPAMRLAIRYAEGHPDVEAIAADRDGVTLVTKGRDGTIVSFTIPHHMLDSAAVTLAHAVPMSIAPNPFLRRFATAAAISPSDNRLVVATYGELFFFERGGGGAWQPNAAACALGRPRRLWEAVDFIDERWVVMTSEESAGRPGVLRKLRCD